MKKRPYQLYRGGFDLLLVANGLTASLLVMSFIRYLQLGTASQLSLILSMVCMAGGFVSAQRLDTSVQDIRKRIQLQRFFSLLLVAAIATLMCFRPFMEVVRE